MNPYKESALRYMTHGWAGPLPIGDRPQQKTAPPGGYTGSDGIWPSEDQIAEWTRERGNRNIGLRLPGNVIGIDVDDYDNKAGADTMIAAAERHGRLPRTWTSTSREGLSGIRWFRLPTETKLPGKLIHPDNDHQSGVEVIQRHHRYAVVPPSVHPNGSQYRWVTPDGEPVDNGRIPKPTDLPLLPQAWLDHIRQECSCWSAKDFDWTRYEKQDNDPVAAAYEKWSARMTESYGRHDAALGGVMALTAFREKGWPGAQEHLDRLERDFYASLGDSRDDAEAQAEWERMLGGAVIKAPTSSIPQWTPGEIDGPATPEEIDARVAEELDRLRVRDRASRLFRAEQNPPEAMPHLETLEHRLANPKPDTVWRLDGWQPIATRVLLAAQYKAGKTTLTGNLSRSLADGDPWLGKSPVKRVGGWVGVLDFEMGERQIDEWMRDQGIQNPDRVRIAALRGKAGTFDILSDDVRSVWAERLRGCDYLILDCLRPILDALGLDEHKEAGRFLTAFDALCDEAAIEDALVVHHMGHSGERSRGDSRLRDWPDVEWRLVRESDEPNSPRYISAYGRDVEQSESQLEFDPSTRHLTVVGGSRHDAKARAAIPAILDYLANRDGATKGEIEATVSGGELARKDVRNGIEIAIMSRQIAVSVESHNRHVCRVNDGS